MNSSLNLPSSSSSSSTTLTTSTTPTTTMTSSSLSSSSPIPTQTLSMVSNQNNNSINNLSQSTDIISTIHPMNLDLYGLSMSPSSSSPSNISNNHQMNNSTNPDLNLLSSTIDSSMHKQQGPPVIYPWMRKVHINNPGKNKDSQMNFLNEMMKIGESCSNRKKKERTNEKNNH